MKLNLQKKLAEKNMTITDLAKKAGLGRSVVSRLANTDVLPLNTKIETIQKISQALNMTFYELVTNDKSELTNPDLVVINESLMSSTFILILDIKGEGYQKTVGFHVTAEYTFGDKINNEYWNFFSEYSGTNSASFSREQAIVDAKANNFLAGNLDVRRIQSIEVVQLTGNVIRKIHVLHPELMDILSQRGLLNTSEFEDIDVSNETLEELVSMICDDPKIRTINASKISTYVNVHFISERGIAISGAAYTYNSKTKAVSPYMELPNI